MMRKFTIIVLLMILCICSPASMMAEQNEYNDSDALAGVKIAKTVFDINLSEAPKLKLYLEVIKVTYSGLLRQGVEPDIVIAFRGPAVTLIHSEATFSSEEDRSALESSATIIAELQEKGVTLEACSIATNIFQVDNKTLLPGIKVVGNTFISLIGYQANGYSLIPIM